MLSRLNRRAAAVTHIAHVKLEMKSNLNAINPGQTVSINYAKILRLIM